MKQFTTRILLCAIPVLLGALIVGAAVKRYLDGEGGFKLGVDLAGGTDLIYEVDQDRFVDEAARDKFDPKQLAASLKRRIDPADLYNVTIRPVGHDRVEIILPTGGRHQAEAEEKVWNNLLDAVKEMWPPRSYKVPVERRTELIAQVNQQHPDVNIASIEQFINDHYKPLTGADTEKKAAAWQALLDQVQDKKQWPPNRYSAGVGRTQVLVNQVRDQYPDVPPQSISLFIDLCNTHIVKSRRDLTPEELASIKKLVADYAEAGFDVTNLSRDDRDAVEKAQVAGKSRRYLTSEEVEHVKELISRVGSLEFRILANDTDDKEAIAAATKFFEDAQKDPERKANLESLAIAGKPPPPPRNADGTTLFPTATNIGSFSYSWVEASLDQRRSMGLANSEENGDKNNFWHQVAGARAKGETVKCLGSCLLYSRNVLNPRLPEKEANKKYEYFILTRDPEEGKKIDGQYLVDAYPTQGRSLQPEVGFRFNSSGGTLFGQLTTDNAPTGSGEGAFRRYLAIILDGKIETAPTIDAIITTDGVIRGNFTRERVEYEVRLLKSGALPATLKQTPVSESTMGATLGKDTITSGTWAVGCAYLAVLLFMIFYYRFAGLVACIALLANLILTVAFMVLVNATFTLPGLAGLVLMLGMAVDANVLIYERLREERDRGASLALAIRNGYDRAFPTIIDTHLSSIFTAIVLYAVGNDQLKGFGISLTVGLIISLFTSLYMTRLLFDIWLHKGWLHKLSMLRLFTKPNIDFMGIRYYWFTATIVLTIIGATLFVIRLDKGGLNIDFMGGTAYSGQLTQAVDISELRKMLGDARLPDVSVEQVFVNSPDLREGDKSKLFNLRTAEKDPEKVQIEINRLLGDKLRRTNLKDFRIDDGNRRITLSFVDPSSSKPAFASRSQVGILLARQLTKEGLKDVAQEFAIEGLGSEEEGRFQWMEVQLVQSVARAKLETAFREVQKEFADRPQPERLENFDSTLAAETRQRALYAIVASWAAILLYLWFRFGNWTFGLAAVLCLIHDLFFTLGIIAFCHYLSDWLPGVAQVLLIQDFKIDLPTVAALLTLVGYSVNDTIVVFDRIREVRGKNPALTAQMINDSVNQTLSRTLLTSFATWLVVIVLYIMGGEGVHLFAFVMVVGVIVGTYSSIYIASPLLLIFGEGTKTTSSRERQMAIAAERAMT